MADRPHLLSRRICGCRPAAATWLWVFGWLCASACGTAQEGSRFAEACSDALPGQTVLSDQGLIEFRSGQFPLILAAPHGGRRMDVDFPVRQQGVRTADSNTDRLAVAIADALQTEGHVPYVVLCHLHRKYMDANRPLDVACDANSPATTVWQAYQDAIVAAKRAIVANSGRGLFVEIHGHGHPIPRLELGYLLRARDYDLPVGEFEKLSAKCSLREILSRGNNSLDSLLRGPQSLGASLSRVQLPAVPSPDIRRPGTDPYFNGGWNTLTHGSRDGGTISSLQIELPRPGMRDSQKAVAETGKRLASALREFMETHYPSIEGERQAP